MLKKFLIPILTSFLILSCSNDDSSSESSNTNGTRMVKGVATFNNGTTQTSRYYYEGNHLVKTVQNDITNVFIYSGENIIKVENYTNANTLSSTTFCDYNAQGKLAKIYGTSLNGQPYSFVYNYNTDNSTTIVKYNGAETTENIVNTGTIYINDGEIIKKVMTKPNGETATYDYTYDDKNNPRKNYPAYYAIFQYSDWGSGVTGNQHNCITVSNEGGGYNYQYEYNSDGYPIEKTRIDSNGNLMDGVNNYYYE